jgi:hypothetical protein
MSRRKPDPAPVSREERKKQLLDQKRTMVEVHQTSLEPVETELAKIAEEERVEAEEAKVKLGRLMVQHVEVLLALVPEHNANGCSDADAHQTYRCKRCALLDIQRHTDWQTDWPFDQVQVELQVTLPHND